ncbi:MAG: PadR family transcriptional regulator [Oculatellaceae cyanobacterium bins.114]|nr:PadR family transcriptional regulator [Oculatellaceae cyanobacterium bins.114]
MALSHAILATLVGQTASGYDLRKQFEGSVGFFWQASFQQIYRELGKLEDQGYVRSQTVHQENRPDKKLYEVTDTGKTYLGDWISQSCEMAPIKDDLLVKVFAGYLVPKAVMVKELEHHRTQHLERLQVYRTLEQRFFSPAEHLTPDDQFRYMTLSYGIRYETGWLAWCEEAIAVLGATS